MSLASTGSALSGFHPSNSPPLDHGSDKSEADPCGVNYAVRYYLALA